LSFGLVLRRSGWRVIYLGSDCPMADVQRAAAEQQPDLVMLSAADPERFEQARSDLTELARGWTVALAGPGASTELAAAVGAQYVDADPVTAAEQWADR
jgi:methanogenic corrinoid protein MtbC1